MAEEKPLPEWPEDAEIPATPVMRVLHVVNATTEGLITTAASSPRGLLRFSNELAGWLGGFDQYRTKGVSADAEHPTSLTIGQGCRDAETATTSADERLPTMAIWPMRFEPVKVEPSKAAPRS